MIISVSKWTICSLPVKQYQSAVLQRWEMRYEQITFAETTPPPPALCTLQTSPSSATSSPLVVHQLCHRNLAGCPASCQPESLPSSQVDLRAAGRDGGRSTPSSPPPPPPPPTAAAITAITVSVARRAAIQPPPPPPPQVAAAVTAAAAAGCCDVTRLRHRLSGPAGDGVCFCGGGPASLLVLASRPGQPDLLIRGSVSRSRLRTRWVHSGAVGP